VSVLLSANEARLGAFQLPSGTGLQSAGRGTTGKTAVAALVLVLATLFLVFIGLLAVAGFTVMAQRRLRALGMLRALGATDRHIRRVMLSNGAAVGTTAAVTGTVVGLAAWFAFAPELQSTAARRVDRLALPWWAVIAAALLTVATAVVAAWWPARYVARVSAVAALSGRPPRPQPAHRFAALGAVGLATGLVLLAFADQHRAPFIIIGTVVTALGVLFLAPLAIRALAALTRRATISVRLAVRDLVRYQARSGAALGAVTMAIGIAATIAVSAAAAQVPTGPANLPTNELVLHVAPPGAGSQVPPLSAAQLQALNGRVADVAASLHARSVVPLEQAYDPTGGLQSAQNIPGLDEPAGYSVAELDHVITHQGNGVEITFGLALNVATPAVLAHYGLTTADISPSADIISARTGLEHLQIFVPGGNGPTPGPPTRAPGLAHPDIQVLKRLPTGSSEPGVLITPHGMQVLGLRAIPAGWLVDTPHALSAEQIRLARRDAAAAGLFVETHTSRKSLAPLRNWSTAAGGLVALGVLGMTVGLIRSETANELRTLAATGASSTTRRALTGVTSGALALLGAVLGTAGAYAALLAWHRSDLSPLGQVPVADLVAILAGVPAVAFAAGWLLAGREPPALSRQPLE